MAEVSDRPDATRIIFSHRVLRYRQSGGHPSTPGQTTTSIPRPLPSWQLPLSIWPERRGQTANWPPVISASPRVLRSNSRDAHSLLHKRAALCRVHRGPALLPRFGSAGWDCYLTPVPIHAVQPVRGLNVMSKDLAHDKRRQKVRGASVEAPFSERCVSGKHSHFNVNSAHVVHPDRIADEPGELVPCSYAV
jgi:hypothetical protein